MAEMLQEPDTQQVATPQAATPKKDDGGRRLVVFLHSVFFVLGFTTVFTLLGSAAGLLGNSLNQYLPAMQRFGAIMLVIFGLSTLGVFRWWVEKIRGRYDLDTNPAAAALVSVLDFFNGLMYSEKRVTDTPAHLATVKWPSSCTKMSSPRITMAIAIEPMTRP